MRSFIFCLLAFLAGFVVAWFAAMVVYIVGGEIGLWQDRDGGVAMGFAFTIGPFFGLLSGIAAAVWVARRTRHQAAAQKTAKPYEPGGLSGS